MPAALITGASTGLGRELAGLFAADGVDVVVVSSERSVAQLNALAEELRSHHGVRVDAITMDLSRAMREPSLSPASMSSVSTSSTWSTTPEWALSASRSKNVTRMRYRGWSSWTW